MFRKHFGMCLSAELVFLENTGQTPAHREWVKWPHLLFDWSLRKLDTRRYAKALEDPDSSDLLRSLNVKVINLDSIAQSFSIHSMSPLHMGSCVATGPPLGLITTLP